MRHSPLCPSQPRPPAINFCTLIWHPPFTKSPIQKSGFYSLVIWVSTLLLQEIPWVRVWGPMRANLLTLVQKQGFPNWKRRKCCKQFIVDQNKGELSSFLITLWIKECQKWLHWFKTSMNSPSQKAWNPHLQTSHWISFCRAERRSMYSETIYRNWSAENPVWHQKQRKKHNIRHHLHFRFSWKAFLWIPLSRSLRASSWRWDNLVLSCNPTACHDL
jgi:hypothetical protein